MDPALDWVARGAVPAWLGTDTAACAAAFEPSIFSSRGADELKRFLAAAKQRGELAILVTKLGDADDDRPRSVMSSGGASFMLPDISTTINGARLPSGGHVALTPGLPSADRDLGLRLLNRPTDAPWWALSLGAAHWERGDGAPSPRLTPAGTLHPILVDALGDPVVAVWVSPEEDQRWYFVPDQSDWDQIIDWVVRQALPTYVPDALRRVRSPLFHDPVLMSSDETAAEQALADMKRRHAQEEAELAAQLQHAHNEAEPIRNALLYGTGSELADAVGAVLAAAGFQVTDLDKEFGATKSADLLAVRGAPRILVEVKSATGRAAESLAGDLQRHLNTWPNLRPNQPVHGAVLVVNHQHKLPPHERLADVYTRDEFATSLPFPVISSIQLFQWWRDAAWETIRTNFLGEAEDTPNSTDSRTSAPPAPTERRRWFRMNHKGI